MNSTIDCNDDSAANFEAKQCWRDWPYFAKNIRRFNVFTLIYLTNVIVYKPIAWFSIQSFCKEEIAWENGIKIYDIFGGWLGLLLRVIVLVFIEFLASNIAIKQCWAFLIFPIFVFTLFLWSGLKSVFQVYRIRDQAPTYLPCCKIDRV